VIVDILDLSVVCVDAREQVGQSHRQKLTGASISTRPWPTAMWKRARHDCMLGNARPVDQHQTTSHIGQQHQGHSAKNVIGNAPEK
jgi:hypothetical protein